MQWTVHKREEEESAGRMEWVEMSVRHDLQQRDSRRSKSECEHGGSETYPRNRPG